MNHQCPGPACQAQIPHEKLACRSHWFQVPSRLRNAVYAAWRGGEGAGSAEHTAVMDAAIKYMRPLGRRS